MQGRGHIWDTDSPLERKNEATNADCTPEDFQDTVTISGF